MRKQYSLALLPLLLLAGCNGDEEQSVEGTVSGDGVGGAAYMSYSYPVDGQGGVSPQAEVVLRFSQAIEDDASSAIQFQKKNGGDVAFTPEKVDNGRSLVLTPDNEGGLESQTSYSVTLKEGASLTTVNGDAIDIASSQGEPGVQFTTRNLYDGPNNRVEGSDAFKIASTVPLPDSQISSPGDFAPMNFSTFRMTTTHPVHPQWRDQGGSVELTDSDGEAVSTNVIIRGHNITVDPCVTETLSECGSKADVLEAGETYTLSIKGLPSKTDDEAEPLSAEFKYTPQDTAPTVVAEQINVDSGLASGASEEQATRSRLNGQIINGVSLNSVLQGVTDTSQQTGSLFAELGYAPGFDANEPLPLRIPRNSVLRGTSIDVEVGGEVPILKAKNGKKETTGDIKVTMISDATGYLSPNPYTDNDNAPRHVTLFMDIAMNTESEQPNAALSQDLMGVELRGIAMVRDGVLTIDAIGVVEPELLGQEYTDSIIAFSLKGDVSEDAPTDAADLRPVDSEPPKLLSWMPGSEDAIPDTRQDMQRPGDPVILNFNEPILESSVAEGISLTSTDTTVTELKTKVDGTTVTINPVGGLEHGVDYNLDINSQLTDLAGNGVPTKNLSFSLPEIGDDSSVTERPPLALTTYPGYPCETDHSELDLSEGVLGQCYANEPGHTKSDWDKEGKKPYYKNDMLPVSKMPSDRPITVVFSQSMKLDSIRLGETFIVEKVSQDPNQKGAEGNITVESSEGGVPGRLEKSNQRIRFYPDEPWEEGAFYRYTMKSDQDPNPNTCTEEPPQAVCGSNDRALKTDLLEGLDDKNNGADPIVIYFEGIEPKETVFSPLRNLPIRDTNSNFIVDCDDNTNPDCLEPFKASHEGSDDNGWKASPNSTKLEVIGGMALGKGVITPKAPAQVGCKAGEGEECPRDKFIYQTYALNTEVKGPGTYDPTPTKPNNNDEIEGIQVDLYPTMLATSSISVFTRVKVFGLVKLQEETVTNTQVLRMRYAKDNRTCESDCDRNSLIPGIITTGDDGQPVFRTRVDLLLDAPDMTVPLGGTHDLYGRPFEFELKGDIVFFDDGRMQIEQRNLNPVGNDDELMVTANTAGLNDAGLVTLKLPLRIAEGGTYLNFISNPVKDLPETLRKMEPEP